jgi:hypothetical protein
MAPNPNTNQNRPKTKPNPRKPNYMKIIELSKPKYNTKPTLANVSSIVAQHLGQQQNTNLKSLLRMVIIEPKYNTAVARLLKELQIQKEKPFLDKVVSELKEFMKEENIKHVTLTQHPFYLDINVFHGMLHIFVYKDYLKIKFSKSYEKIFERLNPENNTMYFENNTTPIENNTTRLEIKKKLLEDAIVSDSLAILNFIIRKYRYDYTKIRYHYPDAMPIRNRFGGGYSYYRIITPEFLRNHIINRNFNPNGTIRMNSPLNVNFKTRFFRNNNPP